jgi:hypothetical protein
MGVPGEQGQDVTGVLVCDGAYYRVESAVGRDLLEELLHHRPQAVGIVAGVCNDAGSLGLQDLPAAAQAGALDHFQ